MRTLPLVSLALLAATGCTPGDLHYNHTGEYGVDARGVAYTDDDSAQVGMNGLTCAINPETSMIEEDVDVTDEDDQVVAAWQGEALVLDSEGVSHYDPASWTWNSIQEFQ